MAEVFKKFIRIADHRICVRHLYTNFQDRGHKGKALKDKLWEATVACIETKYLAAMEELKKIDEAAYNYLDIVDQCMWSRAYFIFKPRTNLLVNNLSESFNSYIIDVRDKPLVAMMEIIRRKLMKRFQLKREGMMKYEGPICPRIQQKLEKNKEMSCECETQYAGNGYYEVGYKGKRYVVSLEEMSCGCRMWDLTGIPCPHAISAIVEAEKNPLDFVDACYSKEKYMKAYNPIIYPVP